MRERKVIVEFYTPEGSKRLDGIQVRFDILKTMSSVMNQASIELCNLTMPDIEYLTTYTSQFIAIQKRKRIRLFAGYDDMVALIFDGDIVEASPTSPPDIWLRCKALSGYYNNKDTVSKSIAGNVEIKDICEQATNLLGLSLNFESETLKTISDFSFTGDKLKIIKEINELAGVVAYEEDGILNVLDKGKSKSGDTLLINKDCGMIGVPRIDPLGIEVKMLLNNTVRIGQKVKLESVMIPSADGVYYIYEIKHEGDLRGVPFYTTIKARRENYV